MKKLFINLTIVLTVFSILLSLCYIILLMLSEFIVLPVEVENNFLFKDWFFMTIPILGFLTGICLQIVSIHKKKSKKQ